MKNRIWKWCVSGLVGCALIAGCNKEEASDMGNESQLASLNEQIASLRQTVASLEQTKAAVERELASVKSRTEQDAARIAALESQVGTLGAEKTAAERELADVRKSNASALDRIAALEADVASLGQAKAAAERELASAKSRTEQDAARIASLESQVKALGAEKTAAERELADARQSNASALARIASLESQVKTLESEKTAAEQELAELKVLDQEKIAAIETLLNTLSGNIAAINIRLQEKVDGSEYAAFVQQTGETIRQNTTLLAQLEMLCSGFGEESGIKEYIDAAVGDLAASLNNYVLESTYVQFYNAYLQFVRQYERDKDLMEAKIAELVDLLKSAEPGGDGSLGDLADIRLRLVELERNSVAMDKVYESFSSGCAEFFDGVNDVIDRALQEDGRITAAVRQACRNVLDEFEKTAEELDRQVADLAGRMDRLEDQMADVIKRIQSLVYVPKTSDGKIHVGPTYIAAPGDAENRIELTPAKKLEYRVSPAELSEDLMKLPLSSFSFYQEHVTRAETPGLDEFHIEKIEPGNGPGELLITVKNEHDFSYQDLAVALCIKYVSNSGVITEFTSPYTVVAEDGRNLVERFYIARKTASGYEPCLDKQVNYLMRYTDTKNAAALLGPDYEVVYDNGESVMSLKDAKERFEWEVDLSWSRTGIPGAFTSQLPAGSLALTPAYPNQQRNTPVTFKLLYASNIGYKVSDRYRIIVSDGVHQVTVIPELPVTVTLCDTEYRVEGTNEVVWQYYKWAYSVGRTGGDDTPYVSSQPGRISGAAQPEGRSRYDLSYLSDGQIADIFSTDGVWTVNKNPDSGIKGDLQVRNNAVIHQKGTDSWYETFSVEGYCYNDGKESVSLSRNVFPPHLIGSDPIALSVSDLQFDAPDSRSITINGVLKSSSAGAPVFYITVSDQVTASGKKLSYSKDEISKYFQDNPSNVSTGLLRDYSVNFTEWDSADGTVKLPVAVMIMPPLEADVTVAGRSYRFPSITALPGRIVPALEKTTVFTAPEGAVLEVKNGPSFPISGTVTVSVEE